MLARALSFSFGATASSRSRNTRSASLAAALAIIFSLVPGVDSSERRRRFVRFMKTSFAPSTRVSPAQPGVGDRDHVLQRPHGVEAVLVEHPLVRDAAQTGDDEAGLGVNDDVLADGSVLSAAAQHLAHVGAHPAVE